MKYILKVLKRNKETTINWFKGTVIAPFIFLGMFIVNFVMELSMSTSCNYSWCTEHSVWHYLKNSFSFPFCFTFLLWGIGTLLAVIFILTEDDQITKDVEEFFGDSWKSED